MLLASPDPASAASVARLEVVDVGSVRLVRLNGHTVFSYACDDRSSERLIATQLAETLTASGVAVAAAFGMHPVTLSRLRGLLRSGGAAALMARRKGPKGPWKVTPRMEARFKQLAGQGLSCREIARRVSQPDREVSYVTVSQVLKRTALKPEAQRLPFEDAPVADEAEEDGTEAALAEGVRESRYAGALLVLAGLERLDLWGIFRSLGASVGAWRRWGWAQTVATVALCFALRFHSIEDTKNALREDLGVLVGRRRSPGLSTLRFKIMALAESVDPLALSRELFRRYLALEPVWEGLYYVDGHFCPYYGLHNTPQGWDARRRLAIKGHTDQYVHDARGRALFFLSQPLNDSQARAIPGLLSEIRQAHGAVPFTMIFDRGGYSGDVFRQLDREGVGFITYLKGRKARRRYPVHGFRRGWFHFERRRRHYRLFEKRTRVTGAGALRTIIFLDDDGQQIPVLTNLDARCLAAKVVHCLRLRWRQENSFKYLRENYVVDQIIQYGADLEQGPRLVPNPKRKTLKERIRAQHDRIEMFEAQLGRALDQNSEAQRPTTRGLKIAQAHVRRQLSQMRQGLVRLDHRLRNTPAQIDAAQAGQKRSLLREPRRLVVNAIKLAAHNAERHLAWRFNAYYDTPKDVLSIFRSLLHLPGQMRLAEPGRLDITLARPDSPKVAAALERLLVEVNEHPARLMGTGPRLHFALKH